MANITQVELNPDQLMTEKDVASLICITQRALQNWRLRGGGPSYVKIGRSVRYQRSDVMKFIEERKRQHTSEYVLPQRS